MGNLEESIIILDSENQIEFVNDKFLSTYKKYIIQVDEIPAMEIPPLENKLSNFLEMKFIKNYNRSLSSDEDPSNDSEQIYQSIQNVLTMPKEDIDS